MAAPVLEDVVGVSARDDVSGEEMWLIANAGTDPEWYEVSGACGGCGDPGCHEGPCQGLFCRLCPTRKATGEVPS